MRKRATVFSIFLFAIAAFAHAGSGPDKAKLQAVLDAWQSMDLSRPAAFYSKDRGPYYDVAPRSYKSWAEYEAGTREMFKTVKSLSFHMANEPQIHHSGNMAWATVLVDGELINKDGSKLPIDARWTSIWEKSGGKWLIVHDHFSMPLPEPTPPPAR